MGSVEGGVTGGSGQGCGRGEWTRWVWSAVVESGEAVVGGFGFSVRHSPRAFLTLASMGKFLSEGVALFFF